MSADEDWKFDFNERRGRPHDWALAGRSRMPRTTKRSLYTGLLHVDDLGGLIDAPLTGQINHALMELRAGARKVVNTMPIGSAIHLIFRRAIVGEGIEPQTDNEELLAAWRDWAADPRECDWYGESSFREIFEQAVGHWIADGESFCHFRRNPNEQDGGDKASRYGFSLRLIEPGRCPIQSFGGGATTGIPEGLEVLNGVAFQADGRVAGYIITNPSRYGRQVGQASWQQGGGFYVRRNQMSHVMERMSAEQTRGVSRLVPAMRSIFHLSEFAENALESARLGSLHHAFVSDPDHVIASREEIDELAEAGGDDAPRPSDYLGSLDSGVGMVRFGAETDFHTIPAKFPDGTTSASFVKWQNELIAASVGIPYHRLTSDLGSVNYSSARVGERAFHADLDALRQMFVNQFVRPAWRKFLGYAEAHAGLQFDFMKESRVGFSRLVHPPIEPGRAATAYQKLIDSGVYSRAEAMRREGLDVESMKAEIERERAEEPPPADDADKETPQSDD